MTIEATYRPTPEIKRAAHDVLKRWEEVEGRCWSEFEDERSRLAHVRLTVWVRDLDTQEVELIELTGVMGVNGCTFYEDGGARWYDISASAYFSGAYDVKRMGAVRGRDADAGHVLLQGLDGRTQLRRHRVIVGMERLGTKVV